MLGVSCRMWQSQFYVSFWSNLCLALLFFLGSLLGQDHTPGKPDSSET
jgi:hypothetical protein